MDVGTSLSSPAQEAGSAYTEQERRRESNDLGFTALNINYCINLHFVSLASSEKGGQVREKDVEAENQAVKR